jgi:hypothetical protein
MTGVQLFRNIWWCVSWQKGCLLNVICPSSSFSSLSCSVLWEVDYNRLCSMGSIALWFLVEILAGAWCGRAEIVNRGYAPIQVTRVGHVLGNTALTPEGCTTPCWFPNSVSILKNSLFLTELSILSASCWELSWSTIQAVYWLEKVVCHMH